MNNQKKNQRAFNALLIKHPTNPNLAFYVTLREILKNNKKEVFPVAKFEASYIFNGEKSEKKFLGLRELYELHSLTHRIIMLLEDYYAGDVDLGSLLNTEIFDPTEKKIIDI